MFCPLPIIEDSEIKGVFRRDFLWCFLLSDGLGLLSQPFPVGF